MFNLSTQEVVLSIEKTSVIEEKQFVYQHYHNFFGNLQELELDIGNLNFDSLENQENYLRKRLSYKEKLSKCLKSKRIAEKEVNPQSVRFVCKHVKAKTEIYMGEKKILKIIE